MKGATVVENRLPGGSRIIAECDDGSYAGFFVMMGQRVPVVGEKVAWEPAEQVPRTMIRNVSHGGDPLHVDYAEFGLDHFHAQLYLSLHPAY